MPATGKCISKIQCVHGTAGAEGWHESMRATPLQGSVLREADTRLRDAQNADCRLLGAESWEGGIEERAHWGFQLKEMKMFWKWAMVTIHFSVNNINHYGIEPFVCAVYIMA